MKKKRIIIVGCVVLFIILAAIIVGLLLNGNRKADDTGTYVMDANNYVQIKEDMQAEVDEGYFETYMNTEWTFYDGQSETQDAILGNSPNNVKPIRCEVLLADNEEKVFSTRVLPVGAQIPPFKLDVDLDKGVYEAVCMVYLLNETEDGTYADYSNAGFNITITVQN